MVTCNKCFVGICVICLIRILENNHGQIPCAFCRNVVGHKLPWEALQLISQSIRFQAMHPPEAIFEGIHVSN